MEVKIIRLKDKEDWNNIIHRAAVYDFYHCHSYNTLDTSGEPFLFVVFCNTDFIALPLIKRLIEETEFYDCTSVYGYPGPIASNPPEQLNLQLVNFFKKELYKYLSDNNIVSVFSRLHPIISQTHLLEGLGKVVSLNKTIAIDTTLPLEIQRQQYQSSNKNQINQLRRKGYVVKKADEEEEIEFFLDIYTETMQRVSANNYYFDSFNKSYFHDLLNADDFQTYLLLAYFEDEIAAGSIVIFTKDFMQYHLSGTRNKYLNARPMKLIIDEARLLASRLQLKYLHLGGGVGGSDTDSLFSFKSSFSNLTFIYRTWQLIVNQEVYENLVNINSKQKVLNLNYFPLYRG